MHTILPLTFAKKGHGKGGRNRSGRITVRHMGGGHKTRIRTVDFHRKEGGPHKIERIERDPGRSGHIALLTNLETNRKSYILATDGLRAGDIVHSYRSGIPRAMTVAWVPAERQKTAPPAACDPTAWMRVPIGIMYSGRQFPRHAVFAASIPGSMMPPIESSSSRGIPER